MRSVYRRLPLACAALLVTGACEQVSARRKIQEGNKAYQAGKYEHAVTSFEAGLRLRPDLAMGWYNLGLAHLALFAPGLKGDENEKHAQCAIEAFRRYLERVPEDMKARDYLLSTYIDSGHHEGALEYFQDRLKKDPSDIEAIAQLAQVNAQAGNFEEAIRWHRVRIDKETTSDAKADTWYSIGVLGWRRLNKHPEVAGGERARIADEGIEALKQADGLRGIHKPTLVYLNLLFRERALAHDNSLARAVDLATAQVYFKQANELSPPAAKGALAPKKP
ncbi:MAG: tetratricopeptide repeat protein [Deltaproteobacteria bacterium]|nr:tetratricopeptide repeat protein [Deltaproteobacteria bacterium]